MPRKTIFIPLIVLAVLLTPSFFCYAGQYKISSDYTATYSGIVPCGKCLDVAPSISGSKLSSYTKTATNDACGIKSEPYDKIYLDCQLCHAFIMLDGAVDFTLINIVPLLAVLMLVIGGVMFYLGGTKPELVNKGKSLIRGVVIGLLLIYGSYLIIGTLLSIIGATKFEAISGVYKEGVFSIKCPITLPSIVAP